MIWLRPVRAPQSIEKGRNNNKCVQYNPNLSPNQYVSNTIPISVQILNLQAMSPCLPMDKSYTTPQKAHSPSP